MLIGSLTELNAQTTIWLEDFEDQPDSAIVDTGPTAWMADTTGCDFTDGGHFHVNNNAFEGFDTDGAKESLSMIARKLDISL